MFRSRERGLFVFYVSREMDPRASPGKILRFKIRKVLGFWASAPRRGVVQYDVVWCGVFGGLPGGHMGVDKAPAEHIYTDNWCEDLGSLKY